MSNFELSSAIHIAAITFYLAQATWVRSLVVRLVPWPLSSDRAQQDVNHFRWVYAIRCLSIGELHALAAWVERRGVAFEVLPKVRRWLRLWPSPTLSPVSPLWQAQIFAGFAIGAAAIATPFALFFRDEETRSSAIFEPALVSNGLPLWLSCSLLLIGFAIVIEMIGQLRAASIAHSLRDATISP